MINMAINWQDIMSKGEEAFDRGKSEQAIKYFDDAVSLAESEFQLAEAFHALALAYLKAGNWSRYFESEKLAAAYVAHIDAGQAADFMKYAGDVLKRLRRCDIAVEAYSLASNYFSDQSSIEKDEDLRVAWSGWSFFCAGKSGNDPQTNFRKAADYFSKAARVSASPALKGNRIAKAHLANALSILFSPVLSKELILDARKHLKKASFFEQSNPSYKACYIAIDSLLFSLELQEKDPKVIKAPQNLVKKVNLLKEALRKMECTFVLGEELDRVFEDAQFNLSEPKKFKGMSLLLLEIVKAVS